MTREGPVLVQADHSDASQVRSLIEWISRDHGPDWGRYARENL